MDCSGFIQYRSQKDRKEEKEEERPRAQEREKTAKGRAF